MAGKINAPRKKRSQALELWRRFKRNPIAMTGLFMVIALALLAIFAEVLAPGTDVHAGYNLQNLSYRLQFPSREFIFGTDNLGRCVFSRVAHGARTTLQVGFIVVGISLFFGVLLGAIAGFYGGITDNLFMRFVDIILAVPNILMAISIAAVLGTGLRSVMIAVGIGAIPGFARQVRAAVLSIKEQEFVEAARSVGANDFRIIRRHLLPNCMAPIIIEATMGMAGGILAAAGLSFIGMGLQPPSPEWGAMLSTGRQHMLSGYWHLTFFPGLFVAIIIFALNMIGDGLRDAFDPRLKTASLSKKQFIKKAERLRRELQKGEEA